MRTGAVWAAPAESDGRNNVNDYGRDTRGQRSGRRDPYAGGRRDPYAGSGRGTASGRRDPYAGRGSSVSGRDPYAGRGSSVSSRDPYASAGRGSSVSSRDPYASAGRGSSVSSRDPYASAGRGSSAGRRDPYAGNSRGSYSGSRSGRSGGSIDDARARARAKARKRKRRRQRRMILGFLILLVLLAIGGIFFGLHRKHREEQKQEFLKEGISLMENGRYQEAIDKLDEALQWSGKKMGEFEQSALYNQAEAQYRLGDYDKALAIYQQLQEADGENIQYQQGVALCILKKGDVNGALAMGVIDGYVYNTIAVGQIRDGDYDLALESIDRGMAVGDAGAMKDLTFNRAAALESKGEYEEALKQFEAYLDQYGPDEKAQREIDFLKSRQGDDLGTGDAENEAGGEAGDGAEGEAEAGNEDGNEAEGAGEGEEAGAQ